MHIGYPYRFKRNRIESYRATREKPHNCKSRGQNTLIEQSLWDKKMLGGGGNLPVSEPGTSILSTQILNHSAAAITADHLT